MLLYLPPSMEIHSLQTTNIILDYIIILEIMLKTYE